jgi:DNA polymerase
VSILAGTVVRAGHGHAVAVPGFDFETASEAGYRWIPHATPSKAKWTGPDGAAKGDKGLEVVGRRNYVKHPTFRVLSLCWDLMNGAGLGTWYPNTDTWKLPPGTTIEHLRHYATIRPHAHPWALLLHVAAGGTVEAWNAGFEYDVWNEHCVETYGWPPLVLDQLRCAAAKARAHAGPGKLERFGDVFNLKVKKDKGGKDLLDLFSVPQKPTRKQPKFWVYPHDDPANFAKLLSYNGTDVLTEAEASLRTPDLSPDELQFWRTDQRINLRGIPYDEQGLDNCIAVVEQTYAKYNAELRTLTNGAVSEASKIDDIKDWLNARGVRVDSLAKDKLDELVKDMRKGAYANSAELRVLEIRQLLGAASIKKLFAIRNQGYRGRLYDLYIFFGARTGRWTGAGPQPQNLPSGLFHSLPEVEAALAVIAKRDLAAVEAAYPKNPALEVIGSVLRGLLMAAPGFELICSDFTAIEGVVTAALANEAWRLEVFHTHGMIYEASAAVIAGVPFDDFVKHRLDTGGVAEYVNGKLMGIQGGAHHPLRKKLGKFAELASGFGGWIPAWCNFGADEYMTEDQIKTAIKAWRKASPNIVELWGGQSRGWGRDRQPELYGLEGAAIMACHPEYRGCSFSPKSNPGIEYQMSAVDDILYCRVPSGGILTYHRPRLEPSKQTWQPPWAVSLSYEGDNKNPQAGPIGWIRMDLYGGKQLENIVQKEARYIHAKGLVRLEQAGYRPIIHSHDEPCGEVPMGWGSVEEFEALMTEYARIPGTFCYGWPIKAKGGWRGPRYGKFD